MNDTAPPHVIDRIESLADGASARVEVPPFDPERHRHRRPEPPARSRRSPRRRQLVAAVVLTSVAASGAAWALRDGDDARSIQTAASDPSEQIDAMVPTQWPAGLEGTDVAHVDPATLGPLEMDDRVASAVLELDGTAAAVVSTRETSLEATTATAPNVPAPEQAEGTLDGLPTVWRDRPDGTLTGFVEVAENRTMVLASRTVDRAGLEQLASTIAAADGDPSAAALPADWTASAPAPGLTDVLLSAYTGFEWSTVSTRSNDRAQHLSVSTMSAADEEAERDRVREFAGSSAQRVDIQSDGDGVLVPFSQVEGQVAHAVVWVPAPGLVSVAIGWGVDADEVVATARSAERPTRGQWEALLPEVDRTTRRMVDGFHIPVTATAIESGQVDDLRWLVTLDRPVIPEELEDDLAAETFALVLVDGEGRQGGATWVPGQEDMLGQQSGLHYVIGALVPKGSTDVRFERNGEALTLQHVVLPEGDRDLHFTVVPAKDVDTRHSGLVTATLPDGTPYVRVR